MSKEIEGCLIGLSDRIDGKAYEDMSKDDLTALLAATLSLNGLDIILECQVRGCLTEIRARNLGNLMILEIGTYTNHLPCQD